VPVNNRTVRAARFQDSAREERRRVVPESADQQRSPGIFGDRFGRRPPGDVDGNAGPVGQRSGTGVHRGVHRRVLAEVHRPMGGVQRLERQQGTDRRGRTADTSGAALFPS